jgi:methylmalonyl-CoA mutase N-terminal domain/subunit
LAFTLRDGIEYVEWGVRAGLDIEKFVPRISFFFNAHNDFFEEIAKYRAARRLWARTMRDRFGAVNERTLQLRFHTQTAGVSLTVQQPLNNVVRVAIQRSPAYSAAQTRCNGFVRRSTCAANRSRRAAGFAHAANHC